MHELIILEGNDADMQIRSCERLIVAAVADE